MYYLKHGEKGDPERLFIGGVGSLYRIESYQGTWVDNAKEGLGIMTYTNGDTLEGDFVAGQPEGRFMCMFKRSGRTKFIKFERGYRVEWISSLFDKRKSIMPVKKQKFTFDGK